MAGIEITLLRNKQYEAENQEEFKVIAGEHNATQILVHYPEEYEDYSKRVDFKNIKKEKWTIGLYQPEDVTKQYDDNFDKLNFAFTLPSAVTINGEIQMQFIAYLTDGTETFVPFQIVKLEAEDSILYLKKKGSDNPDLVIKAYEYSNSAMELAKEAENDANKSAENATLSQSNAEKAEEYANICQNLANEASISAQTSLELVQQSSNLTDQAQKSAEEAQKSAEEAKQSANNASQQSEIANNNSQNALNNSNNAVETANKSLEIVENLSVSKEIVDCEEEPNVVIETNSQTNHKNIKFSLPEPKKGTSYRNRGAWESDVEYINDQYFIDTVSMFGCTYYCKQTNTNMQPINSSENEYWGLLAIKGSDAGITIIDNLESNRADYVLSANQGRILKELIISSVEEAINSIVENAPTKLMKEEKISNAIDNDSRFSTTIKNLIQQNSNSILNILNGSTSVIKSKYLVEYDTREENTTPEEYMNLSAKTLQCEFKSNSTICLNNAGTYSMVITSTFWSDASGGYPSQIAQNQNGIFYRVGTGTTTWGNWQKLSTENMLNEKINDLQVQINNMLNGTTTFTLLKAQTVDLV